MRYLIIILLLSGCSGEKSKETLPPHIIKEQIKREILSKRFEDPEKLKQQLSKHPDIAFNLLKESAPLHRVILNQHCFKRDQTIRCICHPPANKILEDILKDCLWEPDDSIKILLHQLLKGKKSATKIFQSSDPATLSRLLLWIHSSKRDKLFSWQTKIDHDILLNRVIDHIVEHFHDQPLYQNPIIEGILLSWNRGYPQFLTKWLSITPDSLIFEVFSHLNLQYPRSISLDNLKILYQFSQRKGKQLYLVYRQYGKIDHILMIHNKKRYRFGLNLNKKLYYQIESWVIQEKTLIQLKNKSDFKEHNIDLPHFYRVK